MIGQCFLSRPSRGGRGKTVKPEISKFIAATLSSLPKTLPLASLGQKQAMPASKSVCLLQTAVLRISWLPSRLEKVKIKSVPTKLA